MRRWAPPSSARMMLVPLPMLTGGTGTRSGPCAPRPGFWLGTRAGGSVLSPCAQHDVAAQTGACELRLGVPCTRPWDVYMAGGAAPLKRESWRAVRSKTDEQTSNPGQTGWGRSTIFAPTERRSGACSPPGLALRAWGGPGCRLSGASAPFPTHNDSSGTLARQQETCTVVSPLE